MKEISLFFFVECAVDVVHVTGKLGVMLVDVT
jgi:hypothetical protein